jgi:hypothetical protein
MSFIWIFPIIIVLALVAFLLMIYLGGRRNDRKSQARRGSSH